MNIYDWDNTIYQGDSTADFVLWLYVHRPLTMLSIFRTAGCGILYGLHLMEKLTFKQNLYHMFVYVKDIDRTADDFVDSHMDHVKDWYLQQQKKDDMVISASPEFMIRRFCAKLGIVNILASQVDPKTGRYTGVNCHGKEKVRRLQKIEKNADIDEFYSDSMSDAPLAALAKKAYLVKGDQRREWPQK
ncbi:MAG: haloacid dehalogenase-like hydrolase [Erysipelotrichaceae bacterium]|jgi:hypothetical protein|nr:haloacid dehalogenase-like hydrolase [Erysipelotrichaceae bacterium]